LPRGADAGLQNRRRTGEIRHAILPYGKHRFGQVEQLTVKPGRPGRFVAAGRRPNRLVPQRFEWRPGEESNPRWASDCGPSRPVSLDPESRRQGGDTSALMARDKAANGGVIRATWRGGRDLKLSARGRALPKLGDLRAILPRQSGPWVDPAPTRPTGRAANARALSWSSTAPPSRSRCSRASSSATRRAPSRKRIVCDKFVSH
jgi:hypothetical protein